MYLDELVTITEKLRSVNIGDEVAQNYLGAAVINLDHAIERVRNATQQSVHPDGQYLCERCGHPESDHPVRGCAAFARR